MNIHKLSEWADKESERLAGKSEAFAQIAAEITRATTNDALETRAMLECSPKPSDAERGDWQIATKNYVETLESIANGLINLK